VEWEPEPQCRGVEMQPVRLNSMLDPLPRPATKWSIASMRSESSMVAGASGAPEISSELPFSTTNKVDAGTFITKTGR